MNTLPRILLVPSLLLLAAAGVALFALNRGSALAGSAPKGEELAPSKSKLVELAFSAASALPANPHQKTKSRLQGDVVDACLALDAPQRALACAETIENWRRGQCYADLAFHLASHGSTADVQHYLELAQQIAEQGEPTITQDWQKDRIRVAIARTHAWLGHASEAAALESGLEHAEAGKVDAVRAQRGDAASFDEFTKALEKVLATGDFDLSHNALEACAQVFDRYYAEPDRRGWAEDKIRGSWSKLPVTIRLDLLLELSGFALAHADARKALELVDEARKLLDSEHWLPENFLPYVGRIAAARFRAGDKEEAKLELARALEFYDAQRALIVDIYRAGALRPVAEAFAVVGDRAQALVQYKRVVEEGMGNPNSRPRAEDLVATCLSLAQNGVEPDAELMARLERVRGELKAPW